MPEWLTRWEQRASERTLQQIAEQREDDRLSTMLPTAPITTRDAVPVELTLRPSGEFPTYGFDTSGLIGLVETLWDMASWLRFRDGWTIWLTAPGRRSVKLRYPNRLSALRTVRQQASRIQSNTSAALGMNAKRRVRGRES